MVMHCNNATTKFPDQDHQILVQIHKFNSAKEPHVIICAVIIRKIYSDKVNFFLNDAYKIQTRYVLNSQFLFFLKVQPE